MSFFKKTLGTAILIMACTAVYSQTEKTVPKLVSDSIENSLNKAKEKGWLDGVEEFSKIDESQLESITKLTEKSRELLRESLEDDFDYSQNEASLMAGFGEVKTEEEKGNVLYENDTVILISMSMPEKLILSAMRVSENKGVPIYLNGMVKGTKNITESQKVIITLAQEAGLKPKIALNPLAFREYDISAVPVVIIQKEGQVAIKYGMLNVDYVYEEAITKFSESKEEVIHLATSGKLYKIEEKDLIEEIKDRFNQKNWANKKDEAIARFWKHTKLNSLPNATEDAAWYIDPTVRVTKDIRNANGDIIAKAGEVKNPLKEFSMKMTYFIINPTEEKQVQWVKDKLSTITGQFQLMITHIDRNKGWEHFSQLRKSLDVPIFVMPKEVPERFGVKAVPTMVKTTTDGYLKVSQVNLDFDNHKGKNNEHD